MNQRLLLALSLLLCAWPIALADSAADLTCESGFLNPPDSAKPQTWWHWREGRINKEAITAELEAMKRIGVGGVTMFATDRMGETGLKVPCLSPEWNERVQFAIHECDRLGLVFNFANCPGWNGSGGPWITPDKAMQHVVYSKHSVEEGAILKLDAPPSWPQSGPTYYRDIAVLAFPTPAAFQDVRTLPVPAVTSNGLKGDPSIVNRPEKRGDVDDKTPALRAETSSPTWVQFEFPAPVTCRSVRIAGTPALRLPDEHRAVVLASDDGKEFREIARLSTYTVLYRWADAGVTHAIPNTTARFYRLAWEGPVKLALRHVAWSSAPAIYSYESKIGETARTFISEPVLPTEADTAVHFNQILNLTDQLQGQGSLTWTAPKGHWTVVRIGYRSLEKVIEPAAPEATGLQCDKFNPEVIAFHFKHYPTEILKDAAAVKGTKALGAMIFDSWEADTQNWSPVFREEFRKRRGYDVLNYLPAFAGFIVGDRNITDRFLRDVRQTMSDLVSENFFGGMSDLAHKNGLQVHAESCGGSGAGTMVADALQPYLHVDVPMNEFGWPLKEAASAAHVSGKHIVALEAYTEGAGANWRSCPESLKSQGDAAYCAGINRFVFHTYAHNPDLSQLYPGPVFGPYGLAFSRGQTWWEMGHSWITYLSRCQFLLQRGQAAADVLYFYGEEPGGSLPTVFGTNPRNLDAWTALPTGFDYDLLPAEVLLKSLSVKNGSLTLPDGTTYRLLVLRDSDLMTPEAAEKIKVLVRGGATVLGPKPQHSPSLRGYPHCDKTVRDIGDEVWGGCDGKTVTRHDFGEGHVFWGTTLKETLSAIRLAPDLSIRNAKGNSDMRFIHRRDGESEIYFIANTGSEALSIEADFRVNGKRPEIWDPINGRIRDASAFRQQDGRTVMPLQFDRCGSLFVIFRKLIGTEVAGTAAQNMPTFKDMLTLKEPWKLQFAPGWGAPESITFTALEDWSKRPEPSIKYYSGTAIYTTGFDWSGPSTNDIHLDLGDVEVIAEVKVNGIDCGIAWTWPYRVEITKALKSGHNQLEIRVANTWANRLMGESRVADATLHTWTTCNKFTKDSQPFQAGLIGPVKLMAAEER